MPRFAANDVKVVVRGIDLSDHADSVDTPEEKEQIDVSGFSPTNAKTFVPGSLDQTIEVEFLQDFDAQKVHNILYPLFQSGTTFGVYVQPDSDAGSGTTNPTFGGTASLYSYNGLGGASLGEPVKITATFKPASGSTFTWGTAVYT
jgi:hypothetical protein